MKGFINKPQLSVPPQASYSQDRTNGEKSTTCLQAAKMSASKIEQVAVQFLSGLGVVTLWSK